MLRKKRFSAIILGIVTLLATVLSAQSAIDAIRIVEGESGFGTRALGMGGAYTGVANDYSAIYWNPAGLADMQKSQFFGEVSHLNFNNTATFTSRVTDNDQNYTRLRSLGFAFPLPTVRGSLVLAFGYNRVQDFDQNLLFSGFNRQSNGLTFNVDDQDFLFDKDVQQTEEINEDGGLNQWSLGAGIAVSPNFTAGITAMVWSGNDDYEFSFLQEDKNDVYNQFPADFRSYLLNRTLTADYQALGLRLGGMFHVSNGIKLGGTVELPTTFTINEKSVQNDVLTFDDGFEDPVDYPANEFEYKVKTPFKFDAGASFSNQFITLAGALRYRDWSQTKFKVPSKFLSDPDYVGLLEENRIIRRDYEATVEYRLGGEIFLSGMNARLRGGYAVLPSPLKNASSDLDKTFITGGISFLVDRYVNLDLGYIHGSWKRETVDEFTPGGTFEDISTNKFFVGLTYRF